MHRGYLYYLVLPSESGLVFAAVQRKQLSETGPVCPIGHTRLQPSAEYVKDAALAQVYIV